MTILLEQTNLIKTFSGEIGPKQKTIKTSFTVPAFIKELQFNITIEGNSRLAFQFDDSIRNRGYFVPWIPQEWGNSITLTINRNMATRGLEKGPIIAGEWQLHISGIPVRENTSFTIDIFAIQQNIEQSYSWARGDLHSHTNHTDGALSLPGLIHTAKSNHLQFLCLTDHNTISAFPSEPIQEENFVLMHGVEITTDFGHANLFGIKTNVDWRVDGENRTFDDVAKEAKLQGALFSINHPFSGFLGWHDWDMDMNLVDCIEIWNNPSYVTGETAMEQSLLKWNELLNDGYKMIGIGGSDSVHYGFAYEHRPGYPATYLFTEGLTELDLLKALKERRAITTIKEFIHSTLLYENNTYHIGDDIFIEENSTVEITASSENEGTHIMQFIQNGETVLEKEISKTEKLTEVFSVKKGDWIRVQLRQQNGQLVAFANPFFFQ